MKRFIIIILFGCLFLGKAVAQPTVVMESITNVAYYGAKLNAKLTISFGGWTVNGVGFIYDTVPMPVMRTGIQFKQVANTAKIDSIFTFDINTSTQTNLYMRSGKTYYVRAFAKKSSGGNDTVWSAPMSVYIPYPTQAIVMQPTINIEMFKATLISELNSNGNISIVKRGFLHSSTNPMPTLNNGTLTSLQVAVNNFPKIDSTTIPNLTSDLTYYARAFVVYRLKTENQTNINNDTIYSDPINFKTHDACQVLPADVKVDSIDITTAIVSFVPAPYQTQWEIEYDFAGHTPGTGTSVIATNDTVLLVGLTGGTNYSVFVRAICANSFSQWTEIKTFTTLPPLCAPIYNLSGSNYTHSSAKVTWMPGSATQNRWEVRFGLFSQPLPNSGAIVEGDPLFVLIGLTPFTEYKVQVRALCGLYDSDWSEAYSFITLRQGLDDVQDVISKVEIFPNPTNGTIYFKDEKKEDVSKIEIWSSLGELIYKSNYLPETLTLEHYSKGLYLVKIYKEDKVQIEKIILN